MLNHNLSFDGHLLVEVYNDKVIDIMDSLYRVKNINVNKIINAMVLSKDFMNKWYYKLFGKTLKNLQVSFSRTAQLNKYSFASLLSLIAFTNSFTLSYGFNQKTSS